MWGIQSSYDSIEWPGLATRAPNLALPPRILYLETLQCIAARTLGQLRAASRPNQPTRSVAQGLKFGTRFGNFLTHFALSKITVARARMGRRIWIDDLLQ